MADTRLVDRNQYVVKSNDLIQKSRYSLSLEEQRIILFAISKIKPDDPISTWYEFSIADICHACGYYDSSGFYYKALKDDLLKLTQREWGMLPDGSIETVSWIDKVKMSQGSGTVRIRFDEALQPYLFDLKARYTQYKLITVLTFKSKYSVRLYELLRSYTTAKNLENGIDKEVSFDIDELRSRIDAEKYARYSNFKQKILVPAIEEINRYCDDMAVSFEEKREGKRVTKIVFAISAARALQIVTARQNQRNELNRY